MLNVVSQHHNLTTLLLTLNLFGSVTQTCYKARCVILYNICTCTLLLQDGATPLWLAVDLECTIEMIYLVMTQEQVGIKYKVCNATL